MAWVGPSALLRCRATKRSTQLSSDAMLMMSQEAMAVDECLANSTTRLTITMAATTGAPPSRRHP